MLSSRIERFHYIHTRRQHILDFPESLNSTVLEMLRTSICMIPLILIVATLFRYKLLSVHSCPAFVQSVQEAIVY